MSFLFCNPENHAVLSLALVSFLLFDVAWRLYVGAETLARGFPYSFSELLQKLRSETLIWNGSLIFLMFFVSLLQQFLGLKALLLLALPFGMSEQLYCAWLSTNRVGSGHFHSVYFYIRDKLALRLSEGRDPRKVLRQFRRIVFVTLGAFVLVTLLLNATSFCLPPVLTGLYGWSLLLLTYFLGAYCVEPYGFPWR